jgi:transmembrane sensor
MAFLKKYYQKGIADSLLAKYVVNETTSSESSKIEKWIAANEKNRHYVEGFIMIIENCRQPQQITPEIEQASWESFWQSTQNHQTKTTPAHSVYQPGRWTRVAAILVLIVGLALGLYTINRQHKQPAIVMKKIQGDGIHTDTLPDGSQVLLDNHSKLFYPSIFADSQRNVELEGTCFFSVAHNSHKSFRIKVKDILVTVVGTSFTIQSDSGKTEIRVHTGIVEVTRHTHSLRLFKNEKLSVLVTDTTLVKVYPDTSQPVNRPSVTRQNTVRKDAKISPDELEGQKKIVKNIISDIISQRIVPGKDSIEWFGLTDKEFIINGIKQTESTHQKFRKKYPVKPDYGFYFGPVQMTGKGAFITKEDINQ